jgi:hypothetical protein
MGALFDPPDIPKPDPAMQKAQQDNLDLQNAMLNEQMQAQTDAKAKADDDTARQAQQAQDEENARQQGLRGMASLLSNGYLGYAVGQANGSGGSKSLLGGRS